MRSVRQQDESNAEIRRRIAESPYTRIAVCRGRLEHIVGMLRTADLLKAALAGEPLKAANRAGIDYF